jgi:membrane protein YqaA with SNARE-associated domain
MQLCPLTLPLPLLLPLPLCVQVTVAVGITLLYVVMQTFAIPGTISLSLLSGALYGSTRGFLLCALVSTLGSTCCYGMSRLFGRPLARLVWQQRLDAFSAEVAARSQDLLAYIIFLRVTPILPNVFINVASPIVGVPLREFVLGEWCVCGAGSVRRRLCAAAECTPLLEWTPQPSRAPWRPSITITTTITTKARSSAARPTTSWPPTRATTCRTWTRWPTCTTCACCCWARLWAPSRSCPCI